MIGDSNPGGNYQHHVEWILFPPKTDNFVPYPQWSLNAKRLVFVVNRSLSFEHQCYTMRKTLFRNHKNLRQRYNRACGFIGKSAMIKYHQLLSKITTINRKSLFDQLATASPLPILKSWIMEINGGWRK